MGQRDWRQTRDVLICVICAGVIFWALWSVLGQFVEAIVILLLSMAVAFLLTPLVNLLVKYGVPRSLAAVITYVVVLGLISWLAYELGLSLIQQSLTFSNTVITFASSLPETFHATIQYLEKHSGIPAENINAAISQFQVQATDFARSLAYNTLNAFFMVTNALLNIVLVIVLSFYLTLDGKRIREGFVNIVPRHWLPNALLFEDALNRVVGNYIRGQLTLALIIGLCTSMICVATGLGSYALICGVLAFLFETIPMVGPALASITPLLLSLLLPDPFSRTFVIALCFVILQAIESNILGPRIVGHAVGLHPVAAIMALLVGAKLFGVFGALIATPLVAAGWVVLASIYRSARGESADEMLAHKRAPWTFQRPSGSLVSRLHDKGASAEKTLHDRQSEVEGQLELDGEQTYHSS
ncbi:MAG TPA: AI-2E family transporter [Ktedonobacteraceae bacterium]|jgi:predicted PurR-regulated permease PerM